MKMKKVLSILVSASMVLAMATPVLAKDDLSGEISYSIGGVSNATDYATFSESYDAENKIVEIEVDYNLNAGNIKDLFTQKSGNVGEAAYKSIVYFGIDPGDSVGTPDYAKENAYFVPGTTDMSTAVATVRGMLTSENTANFSTVWPAFGIVFFNNGTGWQTSQGMSNGGESVGEFLISENCLGIDSQDDLVFNENYGLSSYGERYYFVFGWRDNGGAEGGEESFVAVKYKPLTVKLVAAKDGGAITWYESVEAAIEAGKTDIYIGEGSKVYVTAQNTATEETAKSVLAIPEGTTVTVLEGSTLDLKNVVVSGVERIEGSGNILVSEIMVEEAVEGDNQVTVDATDLQESLGVSAEVAEELINTLEEVAVEGMADALMVTELIESLDMNEVKETIESELNITLDVDDVVTLKTSVYAEVTLEEYDAEAGVLALDITPKYVIIAEVNGEDAVELASGEIEGFVEPQEISIPLTSELLTVFSGEDVRIEHIKSNGTTYYYDAEIDANDNLVFTNPNGFSTFIATTDARQVSVSFDGTEVAIPSELVENKLPELSDPLKAFDGWTIKANGEVIETTPQKTLTDGLLAKIYEAASDSTVVLTAEANWTDKEASVDFDGVGIKAIPSEIGLNEELPKARKSGYVYKGWNFYDENGNTVAGRSKVLTEDLLDELYEATLNGVTITAKAAFEEESDDDDSVYVGGGSSSGSKTDDKTDEKAETEEVTEESKELSFSDVKNDDWFKPAVEFVYENGIMAGTEEGIFSPNGLVTRGMMVTILWNLENKPEATKEMTFTDVEESLWYYNAIKWASENGIVSGYSAESFGPNNTITREQMTTILYNYAVFKGYEVSNDATLEGYSDVTQISEYALEALTWAVSEGFITGMDDETISPQGNANRAQVASLMERFVNKNQEK